MASGFGAQHFAFLAGLWHDLGKYRPGFQKYIEMTADENAHIEGSMGQRDKTHSAAGALWAEKYLGEKLNKKGIVLARVLQYVIAGHHAGLDNWDDRLKIRLADSYSQKEFDEAISACSHTSILNAETAYLSVDQLPMDKPGGIPGRFALWVRMLFSCLVDADFLDTEVFMDAAKSAARSGTPSIELLLEQFNTFMEAKVADAESTPVNKVRARVLVQCRAKAINPPGVFTLAVPTGGGKTLSSLAFALEHAKQHRKRRIIYAIPYTSIIEQTADVFREVFASLGDGVVIEHHSNAESAPEQESARSRLACENWDAPLIVTTNVQLFESLFARRTSRCRKLHNLVDSVIVLDEAQLLPVDFLQPIIDVLRLLVEEYGVTLVLSTATQPVLTVRTNFDPKRGLTRGFEEYRITHIIDDVQKLYSELDRVRVHVPEHLESCRQWNEIAHDILKHEAVLAIVSRRADARELYQHLQQSDPLGLWHLSALMCGQHRSDVISQIKSALLARRESLEKGTKAEPVRVVSTQLVEAGVDMDFPVVFRALAGLDSIAQAAGRCNREGLLDRGDVFVFVPPSDPPEGLLRQARDACKVVWSERPSNPFDFPLFGRYFARLYHDARSLDAKNICSALTLDACSKELTLAVRFRDASDSFRLIDDKESATVLVRYRSPFATDDVNKLIGKMERDGPERWLMRKLQRYGVTIYKQDVDRLLAKGDIYAVAGCPGLYAQIEGWDGFYDSTLGANVDGAPGDPNKLVM